MYVSQAKITVQFHIPADNIEYLISNCVNYCYNTYLHK